MSPLARFTAYSALLAVLLAPAALQSLQSKPVFFRVSESRSSIPSAELKPKYSEALVTPYSKGRFIHSPSLAQSDPNHLLAVWFAGTEERGSDVDLEGADFTLDTGKWSEPRVLVTRETLEKNLGRAIKTMGNTALVSDGKGRVYLFFVTTSLGGWATSHIDLIQSSDAGATWSKARRLVLSPLLNFSSLVRNKGFLYEDGSVGLPFYHQFSFKYGLVLKMDQKGHVLKVDRIPSKPRIFQPSIAILGPREALAFLRDCGPERETRFSRTLDGGRSWTKAQKTGLPNPNKSVSAESDGKNIYLVFNDSKTRRNVLSLAVSGDGGKSWRRIHEFENDTKQLMANYAYPEIVFDSQGGGHVVYTYNYEGIKHVRWRP